DFSSFAGGARPMISTSHGHFGGDGQRTPTMHGLDLAAFRATPLTRAPFPYLVVPGFVTAAVRDVINADYPRIDAPGSFPTYGLSYGPAFRDFLQALTGDATRAAFEEKFGLSLKHRPTMVTVRGRCGTRDGNIHTDA